MISTDPPVPGLGTPKLLRMSGWLLHKCWGLNLGFILMQRASLYRLCQCLSSTSNSLFPNTELPCLPHLRKQQLGPLVSGTTSSHPSSLGSFSPQALQIILRCILPTLPPAYPPIFPVATATPESQLYELSPDTQRVLACSFLDSPSLTKASFKQ